MGRRRHPARRVSAASISQPIISQARKGDSRATASDRLSVFPVIPRSTMIFAKQGGDGCDWRKTGDLHGLLSPRRRVAPCTFQGRLPLTENTTTAARILSQPTSLPILL